MDNDHALQRELKRCA